MSEIENEVKSVAIGSFDGMHVAHQELIALAEQVVVIEHGRGSLTPGVRRSRYTTKPMAFYLLERVRDLSPERFLERLKIDYPRLEKIVVGYDFRFGRNKEGTPETLERLFSGEVVVVGEISVAGISVHARTIRRYLVDGDLEMANRLLGRPYCIEGEPIRGQGIGGRELVPTINLDVESYRLPAEGVYATHTLIDGERYKSVTFLGDRKTTRGGYAVETHLLDRKVESIHGNVRIEFCHFIRENRRFDTLEELRKTIHRDIQRAKALLNGSGY